MRNAVRDTQTDRGAEARKPDTSSRLDIAIAEWRGGLRTEVRLKGEVGAFGGAWIRLGSNAEKLYGTRKAAHYEGFATTFSPDSSLSSKIDGLSALLNAALVLYYRVCFAIVNSPSIANCLCLVTQDQVTMKSVTQEVHLVSNYLIHVHTSSYNVAPTNLAHAAVLNDFGRSIGAPTARSMMS